MKTTNTTHAHAHRLPPKPLRATGLQAIEDTFHPYGTLLAGSRAHSNVYSALGARTQAERVVTSSAPIRNSTVPSGNDYQGAELRPFDGRPGANDALACPSRVGQRLFYRDGRVERIGGPA